MKKFQLLTKSLLVAAGLLMGASAWAQTVTTYDFEDGNALFTADSRISVNVVEGTQTIYDQDFELDGKAVKFTGASNAQNGYCFAHYDFSSLCDQAAKVKVEFETVLGNGARSIISIGDASVRGTTGNSSKTTYSNKGAIFRVGTDKSNSYVNGSNVGNSTAVSQKWLKVTIEVDEVAKNYTYSIVNKATNEVLYSNGEAPVAFYSSDATNCTQIDMFGYINSSQMGLIDNLVITVTKDERQYANYTVKFVDEGGNAVKEDVTREGAVGDGIILLPADMAPFKNSDGSMKYFYKSDDTEGKLIADDGSTVVTVTYREAETWGYTVNFVNGETILGTKTGTVFEGDQAGVPYPKYLTYGGQLYSRSAGLSTANEFNYKFTPTADAQTKTIEYNAVSGITNVIFCAEAEDIEGMTLCTSGNAGIRSSNSAAAYAAESTRLVTLPAGTYQAKVALLDATTNHNSSWTFNANGAELFTIACSGINYTEYDAVEFTLIEDANICVKGGGGNVGIDALYITGDNAPIDPIYAIYGDFTGSADVAMTKTAENKYTLTIDQFDVEADHTYKYKFHQLGDWTNYQLPASGDAEYYFANAGSYKLTFTANTATHTLTLVPEELVSYTVAGDNTTLFGAKWDVNATDNDMAKKDDGTYSISYKDKELIAGTIKFKVVKNHDWNVAAYPTSNYELNIASDGTYDITINFNPTSEEVIATAIKQRTYVVAGSDATFFGTTWDGTNENNKMTKNEDGTYSIAYTNKALTNGTTIEYKVVADGNDWYPGGTDNNMKIEIKMDGTYDINIIINPTNGNNVAHTMAVYKGIGDAGYATYCAPYDLNFEGTGVTAYIAEVEGTSVSFTEVNDVKANTGLLLKGAEGTYKLQMAESSNDVSATNKLVGTLESKEIPANSFVLLKGDKGVGFYKTNNAFTVGANTAYIEALPTTARFIGFDDMTTAIENVNANLNANGEIYDLQGRRVVAPQKGLYIINGKKVVLK